MDEVYIIYRMKGKDETALDEVIVEYKSYIFVIVNQIIGCVMNVQDIEEVCNDTTIIMSQLGIFQKIWELEKIP